MKKQREANEASYLKKSAEQRQKHRDKKEADSKSRIQTFRRSVRYGRIFECICCHRRLFEDQVWAIKDKTNLQKEMEEKFPGLFKRAINEIVTRKAPQGSIDGVETEGTYHLCHTCKEKLKKGKMPAMSHQNNLQLVDISEHPELELTEVENNLIALNLIFQKIHQLPKSRAPAMKDKIVNVPIYEADILDTVTSLPRTPAEAGIIPVKLKRKVEYKNSHKIQYVSVKKVFQALQTLKNMGNKYYQFVPEPEEFKERCKAMDIEGFRLLYPDEVEPAENDEQDKEENDELQVDATETVQEEKYDDGANVKEKFDLDELEAFIREKCKILDIEGFYLEYHNYSNADEEALVMGKNYEAQKDDEDDMEENIKWSIEDINLNREMDEVLKLMSQHGL